MSETPETRKLEHDAAITKPPLEIPLSTRMLNTKWSKTRTLSQRHRGDKNKPVRLSSSWKGGDTAFSKMHVSHKKKRQMVLAGKRNDTEYTAIVTRLRGAWDRAVSRVWLLTPLGWISIYTLEAENVPVLAGMNLLENHDISLKRNDFCFMVLKSTPRVSTLSAKVTPSSLLN